MKNDFLYLYLLFYTGIVLLKSIKYICWLLASSHLPAPKNHFRYSRGYNLTHRNNYIFLKMKLLRIACYQLESRASIRSVTKVSFNLENILIYDRQMSHYEIYYYNSIIFIVTLVCRYVTI